MINRFALALLVCGLFVCGLSGCRAAYTGVSGSALVRTEYPRAMVKANPPLELRAYDRQWVSMPTETFGSDTTTIMDYAVYGEGREGPITRHAHAIIVQPSNDRLWRFQPESFKGLDGLSIGTAEVNGSQWTVRIARVDGETDWFSAMWRESGRETPSMWLARRFSITPDRATRVIAEYREPWPDCLDPEAKDLMFASKSCLEGFLQRSDAAFELDLRVAGPRMEPNAPSTLTKPSFRPNMRKLVGELVEEK